MQRAALSTSRKSSRDAIAQEREYCAEMPFNCWGVVQIYSMGVGDGVGDGRVGGGARGVNHACSVKKEKEKIGNEGGSVAKERRVGED